MKKYFILIALFLVGLGTALGIRVIYNQSKEITFVPKNVSYQIDPPLQASSGEIISLSGDVKKFSRTSIDFETTKLSEKVLLGEKIATGEDGKATVEFKDLVKITFAPKSEAAFVETIPSQFSVRQANGVVTYESKEKPIFIRSMHMLLSLTGSARVNVDKDNSKITVDILSGTATIGMKDNDNKTNRWDLKMGQRAIIDDESRIVRTFIF